MTRPALSILIANVNGNPMIEDCLTALALQRSDISAEVIVADALGEESNLSTSNVVFSVIGPAVPFDVDPNGGSQDVTVCFSPTSEGVETGNLEITNNDPDESLVSVSLNREGVTTLAVALRINAGGADFTDSNGDLFVADKAYVAGDFGYVGGQSNSYTTDVVVLRGLSTSAYLFQPSK